MTDQPLAREQVPPEEAAHIRDLSARLQAKIVREHPTGIMRRDAHPKMHGLVRAEFIVEPDLAPELRVGIFAEPRIYPAWIRFSNQDAAIQADHGRDIRGMAIKLMDVPGDKLLEHERHERTQDFVLISTNVFVTRDVAQFDAMIEAMTSGSTWSRIWFFGTHWRVVWNLVKSLKRFANPLQMRYWSTTPYLFGATAVKYSAIPHRTDTTLPADPGPDYLRQAMVAQLGREDAVFDFTVQLQTDATRMPIEDPGKEWKESESPFRKVATIRIPQQEFDSDAQRVFGENLSFTPWHSLPAHRPLGGINRARKVVYDAISTFRHDYNHTPRREPTNWNI